MSKSVGNVVDPLKIIQESGADILRLWVASTDYFDDVKIGKEVLAGTSDAYRKLRNTFRYLLGALEGFDESERVAAADMPELERYVLHLLARLDSDLREAADAFEFNRYVNALLSFANNDLSAFFFDVRKDSLYCDAADDPKRRAYRSVLDTLFEALVRYAAPILCLTAEEVWGTRYPEADSIHLETWPAVDPAWADEGLWVKWQRLRTIRGAVTAAIEPLRREKYIGSSLEAEVTIACYDPADVPILESVNFAELAIVAAACPVLGDANARSELGDVAAVSADDIAVEPLKTSFEKCGRCWRHLPEVTTEDALCARCESVLHG
jgi:isoleucyl-tRNA synthetase